MKINLFFIPVFLFWIPLKAQLNALSLLTTTGDFFQTNEFTLSWSLGEVVTETFTGTEYLLTQGFQQPDLTPSGIVEKTSRNDWSISAYPNPCKEIVYITLIGNEVAPSDLPNRFELYDIQGKQVLVGLVVEPELKLDLTLFKGAAYYLRLYNSQSHQSQSKLILKAY